MEQGMLELDENQANVLNCIVDELPPLSREKYRRLALERLGEFLCTKQITLEKAFGLAWILADGWENFVSFCNKTIQDFLINFISAVFLIDIVLGNLTKSDSFSTSKLLNLKNL